MTKTAGPAGGEARGSDTPSWLTGMIVWKRVADSGRAAPATRVRQGEDAFLSAPQAIFGEMRGENGHFTLIKVGGKQNSTQSCILQRSAALLRSSCFLCSLAGSLLCWPVAAQAAQQVSSQHCCYACSKFKRPAQRSVWSLAPPTCTAGGIHYMFRRRRQQMLWPQPRAARL